MRLSAIPALCLGLSLCSTALAVDAKIDFAKDVQPLLAKHCYECHGPVTQKSKLRWDRKETVLGRKNPVFVAGMSAESLIIKLVISSDPDEMMPPEGKGERLGKAQVDVLRAWIDQGAIWPDSAAAAGDTRLTHWAYQLPVRPAAPDVHDPKWARDPIDYFILARLEKEGLKPSPEADRYTLIRRVTEDLTGLPPTIAEVDQFVNDKSPNAYEKVVDRLLTSPRYGERWAAVWLDLARYADSRGYAEDNLRTIWRYRDWVIESINTNKPFDRFTIEQLAGDLLPNPSREQIIATAFHRNTLNNDEGGTDDEEFRTAAVIDRVNTTMQVWMGTTIGCAQCHDHKYDPIKNEEYFKLYAILNQTEDADRRDETPLLSVPLPQFEQDVARLEKQIAEADKQLQQPSAAVDAAQRKWEEEIGGSVKWQVLPADKWTSREKVPLIVQNDGSVLASGGLAEQDIYSLTARTGLKTITAFRLDALPDASLPSQGPGRTELGGFVLSRFLAEVKSKSASAPAEVKLISAVADFSQDGFGIASVIDNKDVKKKGWSVAPQNGKAHFATFIPDKPLAELDDAEVTVKIEHVSEQKRATLGRFRVSITDDPQIARKAGVSAEILAVLDFSREKRTPAQLDQVMRYYRSSVSPELKELRDNMAAMRKESAAKSVETPIMRELRGTSRRKTHILMRGNFLDKGAEVTEGVPAVFPPLPLGAVEDGPRQINRLMLAQWLVDRSNPLTSRVTVNRYWSQLFGVGLVETEDDFGLRSSPPSHPELLDWLAVEFMQSGWNAKAMIRLMVMSASYRQSSKMTPDLIERDPANRLLARGPRVRASAEVIRDRALAVSGLLSAKMFGPSVRPPQPKLGLRAAFGQPTDWDDSKGEDRYRRAVYTSLRRSQPYPSLASFDAPNRQVCTLKRPRTNTPLQALVTLNDPAYVEAAQALARRMVKEGGDTIESRIAYGLRLCVARVPKEAELGRLVELYEEARTRYRKKPDDAKAMAADPIGPLPEGMERSDLAAWSVVANVLLNLDETLTKR